MDRVYYKQYRQLEMRHWWFLGRQDILAGLLRKHLPAQGEKPLKVLNVGAATGRSSEWLREFGEVTSIEYDAECATLAEEFTKMPITVGSAEELPYADGEFDLVTAFDVIEHIDNHSLAATEIARVCKPGGIVFVTVPAFQLLWSEHDEINQHFRRYGRGELAQLFIEADPSHQNLISSHFNFWLFPPIAVVRVISSLLGRFHKSPDKSPDSDFSRANPGLVNRVLLTLFRSEGKLLGTGLRFPWGVSELRLMRREPESPNRS